MEGILVADMELFNKRKDISWYEIAVYDSEFNEVKYAVPGGGIQNVPYLQRKKIEVYIRKDDVKRVTYICSRSKVITKESKGTFISSRICSKIK